MKTLYIFFVLTFTISSPLFAQTTPKPIKEHGKFNLAISGGYSYRLSKTSNNYPDFLKEYYKDLKSGNSLSAEFSYFGNPVYRYSLRYNRFRSKGLLENLYITDADGNKEEGYISDNTTITYIGLVINGTRTSFNKKHRFYYGSGIGYAGYKNKEVYFSTQRSLNGGTLAFVLDFGYEYFLERSVSLSLGSSLYSANLSKLKQTTSSGETNTIDLEDSNIALSRLDLVLGLRVHL